MGNRTLLKSIILSTHSYRKSGSHNDLLLILLENISAWGGGGRGRHFADFFVTVQEHSVVYSRCEETVHSLSFLPHRTTYRDILYFSLTHRVFGKTGVGGCLCNVLSPRRITEFENSCLRKYID
jgi:hypothetical protein